jgi:hypothetical protein
VIRRAFRQRGTNPILGRKSNQAIKETPAAIKIAISGSGIIVDLFFQPVKIFTNDKLDLDYTKFVKDGQLKKTFPE